ncbi:hypothetical protein H0H93_011985 [Arthromyces matolae]|nr:hypothetical protein H0H93_011985 [Arthromyces matolae]
MPPVTNIALQPPRFFPEPPSSQSAASRATTPHFVGTFAFIYYEVIYNNNSYFITVYWQNLEELASKDWAMKLLGAVKGQVRPPKEQGAVDIFEVPFTPMVNSVSLIPDIEDTIFEWTAWLLPGHASSLSVISKRVQKVVERVIYESILFPWSTAKHLLPNEMSVVFNTPEFVETLHARPVEFWTAHVHNVFSPSDVPEVKLLLAKCSKLVNVTWRWDHINDKGALLLLPSAASLSSLSITRRGFMEIATLGVIFVNLKYVDLSEAQVSEFRLPPLSWAPALSILRMELPHSVDSNRVQLVQMIMEDIESLALGCVRRRKYGIF